MPRSAGRRQLAHGSSGIRNQASGGFEDFEQEGLEQGEGAQIVVDGGEEEDAEEHHQIEHSTTIVNDEVNLERMNTPERLMIEGVERVRLKWYLKKELREEAVCFQIPRTLSLLISFAFLVMLHVRPAHILVVEQAIEFQITEDTNFVYATQESASGAMGHKGIHDIGSIEIFGLRFAWGCSLCSL